MRHQHQLVIRPIAAVAAIILAFALAGPASAQHESGSRGESSPTHEPAQRHQIDVEHSTITIYAFRSGLFGALADNHQIQATLTKGFVDDSAMARVDLVVDTERLQVLDPNLSPKSREVVQTRMLGPDVLDATRFPQIRFHSTAVQRLAADRWLVRGDLDLHGQTRQVEVDVVREDGRYAGRVSLRQSDFAIAPISVAGGTIKVKDELSIEFDIVTADR